MSHQKFLLVIPSIDIKNGRTVRVVQGIPELNCESYGDDPIKAAKLWRAENAKMIHIVDFDGAIDNSKKNLSLLSEMCSSVVIPIEFAGGIRSVEDADICFDAGICRVAINTLAIENIDEFKKIFEKFGPKRIVISLDIVGEELISHGRQHKTGIHYLDFSKKMKQLGVERFIVTDVTRNGLLQGPNLELSKKVATELEVNVTHSGGIRNKDELMDIQELIPIGVDSVIVGRAFYENRFPCQKLWRVAESGIFN